MVIISSREHCEDMFINITGMLKYVGNKELGRTRKAAIVYWQGQGEAVRWMGVINGLQMSCMLINDLYTLSAWT